MTNSEKQVATNQDQVFKATLSLTQYGTDGEVFLDLQFEPKLTPENVNMNDIAPTCHQIMSELAAHYLFVTGFIDEEGNLINPDQYIDRTNIN